MNEASTLGYDTKSMRSALVMRAVDLLNPFKRARPFRYGESVVVSSTAGLGDLFIHLPLISGIVLACRSRRIPVRVALRPAHLHLGMRCGWATFPFDNGLEEFFKRPGEVHVREFVELVRRARQDPPDLWIDLTGSALSAIAIKSAGAKRIAARVTRGGASLIDHPLPHRVQENEYDNRQRVADYLGCEVDHAIAERLRTASGANDSVVLAVTTASQWKSWPVEHFRALAVQFPRTPFTVVGFRREVAAEKRGILRDLLGHPNVRDAMDLSSTDELVDIVARARAVVTNDTSAAHIANFFGKPGAVLFGPVSPRTFAARDGLRVFHDATCPFHPCVQWRCKNQANWCMRKIDVTDVAAHLAKVLALDSKPLLNGTESSGSFISRPIGALA